MGITRSYLSVVHFNASCRASVTELFDGTEFSIGPELLVGTWYHCTAEVEPGKVLVAGGRTDGADFYIIDVDTGDIDLLPNIPISQFYGQACGTIPSDSGGVELVTAGGALEDVSAKCCI